jgi:hypothetical protein
MKLSKLLAISGLLAALMVSGCSDTNNSPAVADTSTNNGAPAATHVQVEQLARPGINEALLRSNSFLGVYNAVGPAFIAAALSNPNGPEGQAAAPVLAEAVDTLNLFTALDGAAGMTTAAAVGAFLPDVMRIDTTVDVPVAGSAYAAAVNNVGSPVAGRKLTDDVIDITLSVLTGGAVTTDFVPYYTPGNGNAGVGHQNLNGQAAPNGAATFPFLAPAN